MTVDLLSGLSLGQWNYDLCDATTGFILILLHFAAAFIVFAFFLFGVLLLLTVCIS